jgi:hypothetical protein
MAPRLEEWREGVENYVVVERFDEGAGEYGWESELSEAEF